jgi:hypothetical protein
MNNLSVTQSSASNVLPDNQVRDLVKAIATTNFGAANLSDVQSAGTTDLEGNSALEITVILTSVSSAANMPPGAALKPSSRSMTNYCARTINAFRS